MGFLGVQFWSRDLLGFVGSPTRDGLGFDFSSHFIPVT